MKNIYILCMSVFLITACSTDLDQSPENLASANSLTDYEGVLNAAYFYQLGTVTPLAIMGDFRADNAFMFEPPYTEFDEFDNGLTTMEDQFFGPFYSQLYKCILSANNVIENSTDATEVGEAKFLRALSYFKLVKVFGAVPVNLSATPSTTDTSIFARQPAVDVYNNIVIEDLNDAITALNNNGLTTGRASKMAAQSLLGKVYATMGNYGSAQPILASVVSGASAAGISLKTNFSEVFGAANEVGNSEIIYATQISSSIVDEYSPASDFWNWFVGDDSKSDFPVDADLNAAFDASDATGNTDLRRAVTISADGLTAVKFPKDGGLGPEHDWIEIRLADMILLYAEALNENGSTPAAITELNKIRKRAGLSNTTATTKATVATAIANERRLELAFEGHRWFDLVRTGTAQSELNFTNPDYLLFPIPVSEILATRGVITQNDGY